MFFELQAGQIEKWLLNPYMYGVVAGLTLVSLMRRVEPLDRRYWIETGNDFLYGVGYAVLYFPLIAICLNTANSAIDAHLPWLRVEFIAGLAGWQKFLIIVLLDDFLSYWSHRLRHQIKPLWYFHAIHHSQRRLNPLTTKRFHPLENLFHKMVFILIPMAIVGGSMELWYAYFLLDAVWDYFIHSNIRLNLGPLKYIFVTPQYHRVHHSREQRQFDRNYADRFVIWDYLFGTIYSDYDVYPETGVPDYPDHRESGWTPLHFLKVHYSDLTYPFRMISRDIQFQKKQVSD